MSEFSTETPSITTTSSSSSTSTTTASTSSLQFIPQLELFDDGFHPGGTSVPTKIATYNEREKQNFLSIYDDLLPDIWRKRIYEFSLGINEDKLNNDDTFSSSNSSSYRSSWGAYISVSEALDVNELDPEILWKENKREKKEKALALVAARTLYFFNPYISSFSPSSSSSSSSPSSSSSSSSSISPSISPSSSSYYFSNDVKKGLIHGISIWSLTSEVGNEVQYHIDYAELYRYEKNIIVPPLYAGVYHASPLYDINDKIEKEQAQEKKKEEEEEEEEVEERIDKIIGGGFCMNINGLKHYKKCGYKCKLSLIEELNDNNKIKYNQYIKENTFLSIDINPNKQFNNNNKEEEDKKKEKKEIEDNIIHIYLHGWIRIPYRKNRAVIYDGDYPHYGEPIKAIISSLSDSTQVSPSSSTSSSSTSSSSSSNLINNKNINTKRVILGFNVFPIGDVGETSQRAPEHSSEFNKTIKLYQRIAKFGSSITNLYEDLDNNEEKKNQINDINIDSTTSTSTSTSSSSITTINDHTIQVEENKNKNNKIKKGLTIDDLKKNSMLAKIIIKAAKLKQEKKEIN